MGSLILAIARLLFASIPDFMDVSSKFKENSLELFKRWNKLIIDEKEKTQKNKKRTGMNIPGHDNSSPDVYFHVKTENVKLDHSSKNPDAYHKDPELKSPTHSDDKNLPNDFEVSQLLKYISNAKSLFEDDIAILTLLGQIISGESCEENVEVIERLCICRDNSYDEFENIEKFFSPVVGEYQEENSSKPHLMRFSDDSLDLLSGCRLPPSISEEELKADSKRKIMPGLTECANLTYFMTRDEGKGLLEMNQIGVTNNYKQGDEEQNQMQKENVYLKKQLQSLEIKYNEVLNELGKIMFIKEAKESEKRKSQFFQQMFPSSPYKDKKFSENEKQDFLSDQTKVDNAISPSNFFRSIYNNSPAVNQPAVIEPPVPGAEALLQKGESNCKNGGTRTTKTTKNFDFSLKQGIISDGNSGKNQLVQRTTKETTGIIDLEPFFQHGATGRGKEYEINVNQGDIKEIMVVGDVGSSSLQGTPNCSIDNINQVKREETIATKRMHPFGSFVRRGTTISDKSEANFVLQGENNGESFLQHEATSGGKGFESKSIQRETKETKVAATVGSPLQKGTKNGGKDNTNRVNEEETGTTKKLRDFGLSPTGRTTSPGNIKGDQENQGDAKKTNKTRDLGSHFGGQDREHSSIQRSYESLSFSVQQDDRNGTDYISLSDVPPISVASSLYNNYKLLLLTLAERLLSSQVLELKKWASQKFSVNISHNATEVLFQLDKNGAINASNLSELRDFLESILRYDLVHIIDTFLLGDYSVFWQTYSTRRKTANDQERRSDIQQITPPTTMQFNNDMFSSRSSSFNENTVLETANHRGARDNAKSTSISNDSNPNNLGPEHLQSTAQYEQKNITRSSTGPIDTEMTNTVVADHSVTSNGTTNKNSQAFGSNGFKLSKFQSSETRTTFPAGSSQNPAAQNEDINWLCSHYRRRCYVKFECCDNFWPCHRCHNNQSTCGRKKLKSRDTKMLKCVNCGKVQQFGEFCCECNIKFANYYCGLCKHLTGTDDHPFHCQKCGICRIHGDRSFHCDICGVCLDVQLRGNHKCREDSAHDECCICLEDAFTGCQILPCSHKVHKECATQMIRTGITRCPICRESFAHKLEPRPKPGFRKNFGK